MDGGYVLVDSKHALTWMGHRHFIESAETLKIGNTELTIKGQFSHVDKYVDQIGVVFVKQDGGHLNANWNYEAPAGEKSVIQFDNVEHVDAVYDKNMRPKRIKVTGELLANCNIVGNPEVKAYLNFTEQPEDLSFHRSTIHCMKSLNKDKNMQFTPPSGRSCLMGYS